MRKILSLFFTYFLIVAVFYWGLWTNYFQQDEWFLFGRAIYQSQHLPLSIFGFASMHFWPLGNVLWLILYKLFGLNAAWYALFALMLQATVATAVFFLFKTFTKHTTASFLMALLFTCSFPAMQPVVWFVIPPFLLPCTFFIIMFFLYLHRCTKQKVINLKDIAVLAILFVISYFFREEAVVLIPLTLAYLILFWEGKKKLLVKKIASLEFIMLCFVALRFVLEKFLGDNVVFSHESRKITTLYNIITVPPKMIVQSMVDLSHLWDMSRTYVQFAFPNYATDGIGIEQPFFEHVVVIILIPIAAIAAFAFSSMKKNEKKLLAFSLCWIIACAVVISPQTRRLVFLESRYLYIAGIGVLLFLFTVSQGLMRAVKHVWMRLAIAALILVFLVDSFINVQTYVNFVYKQRSEQRKQILDQIISFHPRIPKHTVIYVECISETNCIPNGLVLPFQSGVGQMLMVLYSKENEKAFAPFFKDFYLWDWEAQGYKELNDVGFGYYRQYDVLVNDFKKKEFKTQDIIGYSYDYKKNQLQEISKNLHKRLMNSVQSQ